MYVSKAQSTQLGLSHPVQLFTPEKRDTLAFHIMTKEIYPHSVMLAQYNPSKQVRDMSTQLKLRCAACLLVKVRPQ